MSLSATMDAAMIDSSASVGKRLHDDKESSRDTSEGPMADKRARSGHSSGHQRHSHLESRQATTVKRRPLSPTLRTESRESDSDDSQSLLQTSATTSTMAQPSSSRGSTPTLELMEDEILETGSSGEGKLALHSQNTLEYDLDNEHVTTSATSINGIRNRSCSTDSLGFTPGRSRSSSAGSEGFTPTSRGRTTSTDSQGFTPRVEICLAPSTASNRQQNNSDASDPNKLTPTVATSVPPSLERIASVQRDAEVIAEMLNSKNLSVLYEKILKRRQMKNRVEIVTNEVLEEQDKVVSEQDEGRAEMKRFIDDIDGIVHILKANYKLTEVDADEVYALLESYVNHEDRVDEVVKAVIRRQRRDSMSVETLEDENQPEPDDIFSQVEIVMKEFPDADANEVYTLLEKRENSERRVAIVIGFLKDRKNRRATGNTAADKTHALLQAKKESITSDQFFKHMRTIAEVFPDRDEAEIYSHLETYHDKPDRVHLVIKKMMETPVDSQESSQVEGEEGLTLKMKSDAAGSVTEPVYDPAQQLSDDVEVMKSIFPDCDPDYLYTQLESMSHIPTERVAVISANMFENKGNYPRLKDRLEKEKKTAVLKRMQSMEVNIKEFLHTFPEPATHFYDVSKAVTGIYREHAQIHLQNTFPYLHKKYIDKKLEGFNGHLTPTLRALDPIAAEYFRGSRGNKYRRYPRPSLLPMPEAPDEYFYKELLFTRNEKEIQDYITKKKQERDARYKLAEERGELMECTCCYDDKVLFEDMQACPEGHIFCQECICRSAAAALSEAKANFRCLQGECELQFSHKVLQMVLPPAKFSILLRRVQEEEIRLADIPNLVACPFCSFATIMNEEDGKVLHCLNPECLKESCRLCKEPNHVPLRCEEVEKQSETSMRAYIEAAMTEAMLRTCHQCNKRFFKTEGCNKMTCICGASMCYVCRQPINDYEHFNEAGDRCNNAMAEQLHKEEMEAAAEAAKNKYLQDHPEAAEIELKYDPLKLLKDYNKGFPGRHDDEDGGGSDDEEERWRDDRESGDSDWSE